MRALSIHVQAVAFFVATVVSDSCFARFGNDFAIEKSVGIDSRSSTASARVNLGDLEAGSKGVVNLLFQNNTDSPFKISKIEVGCSCISAKAFGDVVPSGGAIKLQMELSVPEVGSKRERVEIVRVVETENSALQILVSYGLAGAANFAVTEISPKVAIWADNCEFDVPVFISSPIQVADLNVYGTGDLTPLKCVVKVVGDLTVARCSMTIDQKSRLNIAGELHLEVANRKLHSAIPCFISRQSEIVLMPSITRFDLVENKWIGNVSLRDNRLDNIKKEELSIACVVVGGEKVDVEVTKVKSLYRLVLSMPSDRETKDTISRCTLNWQIGWNGGISEFSSRAIFLR